MSTEPEAVEPRTVPPNTIDVTRPPMVVLRPGDKVLITLTDDQLGEDVGDYLDTLRTTFPGVEFLVMTGVAQLIVSA